jgi:multimeric flavodoxin WrbA
VKALLINCPLKPSPEKSNTEALADVVAEALRGEGVEVSSVRAVDHSILPTWLGRPSSIAKRVLERMDAMLSETDDEERPVAYDRVAGVVVTGNEDGAHHTEEGHEWSHSTGRAAAANLLATARALESTPIPAPPSE